MPIYEYECRSCGHRMEAMHKISDSPLTDCPVCTKSELVKLISATGFRLSGGGWYETDFKTGTKKNVVESTSSEPSSSASGSGDSAST